jgi:hypothetical protein
MNTQREYIAKHGAEVLDLMDSLHDACVEVINNADDYEDRGQDAMADLFAQVDAHLAKMRKRDELQKTEVVEKTVPRKAAPAVTAAASYYPMPTPYEQLMAKAAELRKAEPKLSEHQAFAKAYASPANRSIALAEREARQSKANTVEVMAKAASTSVCERVHRAAAAVQVQHPRASLQEAIDHVLGRDPTLRSAYEMEQAAASSPSERPALSR